MCIISTAEGTSHIPVFSPEKCLRRVHWVSLVGVEEYSLTITSTDVVSHTPHGYSGAFQGGYSARSIASRRLLHPLKTASREQCHTRSTLHTVGGQHCHIHSTLHTVGGQHCHIHSTLHTVGGQHCHIHSTLHTVGGHMSLDV